MFYIMVLESNQQEREKLEHYFSQSPFAHETNLLFVSSYEEMNEHLKDHLVFDAFFIDVDGTDVDVNISQSLSFTLGTVKNLMLGEVNPQIVIMTSSAQKAEEFSKQHNIMVLPKPFSERDFFFTYNQILAKATELRFKPFGIKVGGSIIQIYPREITYIESLRRKVDIHTDHGNYEIYATLRDLEEFLPPVFCQTHKSFLVNLNYVVELNADGVKLKTGETLPVSQARRKPVRHAFMRHLERIF